MSKVGKVMKKVFLDKGRAQKCGKTGLFSKAWVSVWVLVRPGLAVVCSCENVHF